MSTSGIVAILGAGPIGASVAQSLALRSRVADIRLIDAAVGVAAGKALDIRQSGPIDGYDTRVSSAGDVLAAASADVIVVADEHEAGEWDGERGLALIGRLVTAGITAPIVFAGTRQLWLLEACARELGVGANKLIGSAAAALAGATRSLVALEVNGSGVDVSVAVCGRPPAVTIGWTSATIGSALVTDRVPAHRLLAIASQVRSLWPVRPYVIASATALIVEGLVAGTRQATPGVALVDGEFGVRGRAALLSLSLGNGRVLSRHVPTLSPQERTEFMNSLHR